ncbi:hypothetical protein LXM94_24590, partial [Rhizobium sp. TRM95111]|nr:hypothetical protein [Rhizobium alarense]
MATEENKDLGGVDPAYREQVARLRTTTADINAALAGPTYGVTQIDDKPATSVRFERAEKDGEPSYTVSFHMGNKVVARLKDLAGDALADAVGDKNAKTILEHADGKGSLKGEALHNEYGLSPEESARRIYVNEMTARHPAGRVDHAAEAAETNVIEHTPERSKQVEEVNVNEALTTAAKLRQRDRE